MKLKVSQKREGFRCHVPKLAQRCLVVALGLAACPLAANAVSFTNNGWTVDFSGFANAYYTYVNCPANTVGGLALAGQALGCAGQPNRSTIGNGLLPNELITKVSTTQDGLDISAEVGLAVPIATSNGISNNNNVDIRQAYFTVGTKDFGTVKLGRDYGIFGSNAILSDMTLLGVGAPVAATQRGRVALGHIGAGYTYLGDYAQITYTSPSTSGFTFTGGVFSPVDNFVGTYDSRADPQVQLQLAYAIGGFKAWIGGKTQKFYAVSPATLPSSFTMAVGEVGGSYTIDGFSVLANVQTGRGLGILIDGDEGDVKGMNYLLQGTYQVTPKLKLGLSGGVSRNRQNPGPSAGFLKSNTNVTAGVYYSLTKSVTLVAEIGRTRSKDFLGHTEHMNGVDFGGIIFF